MLLDTFDSQRQPVKIVPGMNREDLLRREAVCSEPGNGSEVLPSYNFSWTVSEMTGRDRGEAGQRSAWLQSDECCEVWKYFPPQVSWCNVLEGLRVGKWHCISRHYKRWVCHFPPEWFSSWKWGTISQPYTRFCVAFHFLNHHEWFSLLDVPHFYGHSGCSMYV